MNPKSKALRRDKKLVEEAFRAGQCSPFPVQNAPRHTRRVVVWHESGDGVAMLLVGYCPQELAYYLGLAKEFLKTFPDANIGEIGCHHITKSHHVKGFTLAMLSIKGPKRVIKGYEEWSSIDFNY